MKFGLSIMKSLWHLRQLCNLGESRVYSAKFIYSAKSTSTLKSSLIFFASSISHTPRFAPRCTRYSHALEWEFVTQNGQVRHVACTPRGVFGRSIMRAENSHSKRSLPDIADGPEPGYNAQEYRVVASTSTLVPSPCTRRGTPQPLFLIPVALHRPPSCAMRSEACRDA